MLCCIALHCVAIPCVALRCVVLCCDPLRCACVLLRFIVFLVDGNAPRTLLTERFFKGRTNQTQFLAIFPRN